MAAEDEVLIKFRTQQVGGDAMKPLREGFDGLAKSAGRARDEFGRFVKGSESAGKETEKTGKRFKDAGKDIASLAQTLKSSYGTADRFARSLGLTASKANDAVQRIRELDKANATVAQKFKALNQELGVTKAQFIQLNNAAKSTEEGMTAIAAGATAVAAAISAAFIQGTQDFVAFDRAIRQSGVVSGASGTPELEALREEVERLGLVTSKAPAEIARMSVELSRAGFSAEETAASLEGIVRASEATGDDLVATGDIVAKTIRTYALSADQSIAVADALVETANSTNSSVTGLGESLQYVGSVAFASNQPLEDTLVLLGLLGDAGIQGSQAGTNLAAALERLKIASAGGETEFSNLVRGSARMTEAFNEIGAEVRNTDGTMKSLLDILPIIQQNLSGLSQADKDVLMKALFGVEGGRAFQTLLNVTPERLALVTEEIKNAEGAAVSAGLEMQKGLPGALDLLGNSLTTASTQIGEFVSVGLEPLVRAATVLVSGFLKLPAPIQQTLIAFTGFVGVLAAATAAVTAYNLVNGKFLVQTFLANGQIVLNTAATTANTAATQAATLAKTAYAVATGKATISLTAFTGAARAASTVLGPLVLLAGALAAIEFLNFAEFNDDLQIFIDREQSLGQQSIDIASRIKGAVEDQNEARQQGRELTADEIRDREQLIQLGKDQIAAIEAEIKAIQATEPVDEQQRASQEAMIANYQRQSGAIQNQIDALGESTAATGATTKATEDLTASLDGVVEKYEQNAQAIAQSEADKNLEITRLQAEGAISAEEAEARKLQAAQERIAAELQAEKDKLTALEALGVAEDPASERERQQAIADARARVTELETQQLEEQIQERQRLREEEIAEVERLTKEAADAITLAETQRLTEVQRLLNAGVISEEEAQTQRLQATRDRITAELQAEQQKLAQLQALPDPSDPEQREQRESEIRASIQRTADLQLQLLENEQAQEEAVRAAIIAGFDRQIAAAQRAAEAEQQGYERQIALIEQKNAALSATEASLQRQSNLLASQSNLEQALSGLRQSGYQIQLDNLTRAAQIQEQLSSGEITDLRVRQQLERELGALGVSRSTSAIALLQRRQAIEDRLATEQLRALQQQQTAARAAQELELRRNELAARREVIEARIAQIQAQQNISAQQSAIREAQLNVERAQASGDEDAIANAQAQLQASQGELELAQQQATLAEQSTQAAQENLEAQAEIAENARATLEAQQQAELATANSAERAREFAQQLALAEASAANIARNLGTGNGNVPSLRKGGPVEAGQLYQVHRDEFFVPKQDGTILNQNDSRELVRRSIAQTNATPMAIASTSSDALLREIQGLRADLRRLKPGVQVGSMPVSMPITNQIRPDDRGLASQIEQAQVEALDQLIRLLR